MHIVSILRSSTKPMAMPFHLMAAIPTTLDPIGYKRGTLAAFFAGFTASEEETEVMKLWSHATDRLLGRSCLRPNKM